MRVAVLGQGSIGRRHAVILRDLGCEVVTYDPVAEDGASSEEQALETADAAVVASPSSEHQRQALSAIAAGLPVLVEKPLALDQAGAIAVARAADSAGIPVEVAMNLRHHPGVLGVRALLPGVGPVVRAAAWCGSWLPGWRPHVDYRETYSARRALGGGVLLDAIHEIDYVLWLLGPVEQVGGMTAHASSLEIDVEDVAQAHLRHAGGAISSITLDYLDCRYHRGCRVVGEHGTVEWDWERASVRLHRPDGTIEERAAPADPAPTYVAQMRRFLEVVEGRAEPLVGVTGGDAALAVVDAVREDEVRLRGATIADEERLLGWRNDPEIRAMSRSVAEVAPEEHRDWIVARLGDTGTRVFIVEHRGTPVGQVRVDRLRDTRGEIHIALGSSARGLGLGTRALQAAATRGAAELGLTVVEANVRDENERSLASFARAGFAPVRRDGGIQTLEWAPGA